MSLCMGPVEDHGGGLLYRGLERMVRFSFTRRCRLLGTPGEMKMKVLKRGSSCHRGTVGEPRGGGLFYQGLRETNAVGL